jgi:flagellin-like protein
MEYTLNIKERKMKDEYFLKNRKGISPTVTTVLLIVLVIAVIGIIYLWFNGMVEEGVTKFGKNIQLACEDVNFETSYSSGILSITNNGNIALYRINLRISAGGSYQTRDITEISSAWPDKGLNEGGTFSEDISGSVGNADTLIVYPILIGTSGSGKKTFVCEGQYGKEIKL